jgi:hypothetical protein
MSMIRCSGCMTPIRRRRRLGHPAIHKAGELGRALSAEEQVVLLIDEIDKADLSFPTTFSGSWIRWSFISRRP